MNEEEFEMNDQEFGDVLTSTRNDGDYENLDDITFQSTINANEHLGQNFSDLEPAHKKSKYLCDSSENEDDIEVREVTLYKLKSVVRGKFGGPIYKFLDSNGIFTNYHIERTTKKFIKINCVIATCLARMSLICKNEDLYKTPTGTRNVIKLDNTNENVFNKNSYDMISTSGIHTCNTTATNDEKQELMEYLKKFIYEQSDISMISIGKCYKRAKMRAIENFGAKFVIKNSPNSELVKAYIKRLKNKARASTIDINNENKSDFYFPESHRMFENVEILHQTEGNTNLILFYPETLQFMTFEKNSRLYIGKHAT